MTARRTLLSLPLFAACATAKARPRTGPAPTADELVAALRRRHRDLRTLEMEALATSWLGGQRTRGTVAMLADRTGRLRFDAEVQLQGDVSALAVADGRFMLLDFDKRVFHTGPACPRNVARLIPIPLAPEELAAILLGDAPLGTGTRPIGVEWDGVRGAEVLALERPRVEPAGTATRLWVGFTRAAAHWRPSFVDGQSPGAGQPWRVSFEDHEAAGALSLPRRIRFAEPGRSFDDGVDVKVKVRDGVNRPISDDRFHLAAPEGWMVEQLACNAGPTQGPTQGQ